MNFRCACDVPAVSISTIVLHIALTGIKHNYTFSWEPSPEASAVYVSSQELYRYFKRFSAKHKLERYIHVRCEIISATWKGTVWDVEVYDHQNDSIFHSECDVFISATGVLNKWSWPAIKGLEKFQGNLLHSANWDSKISLDGKRVGLIGNG